MEETKETTIKLSVGEVEQLKNLTKAYTPAELLVIIESIPSDYLWDELIRRDNQMLQNIFHIEDVLGVSLDNIRPIPLRAWEDIRGRYNELKSKYRNIREGLRLK